MESSAVVYDELNEMMMSSLKMHDFHRQEQLQVHDEYLLLYLFD